MRWDARQRKVGNWEFRGEDGINNGSEQGQQRNTKQRQDEWGPNERGCFRHGRGWMRRDKLGVCEEATKAKRRANRHERRNRACHARCQGRIKGLQINIDGMGRWGDGEGLDETRPLTLQVMLWPSALGVVATWESRAVCSLPLRAKTPPWSVGVSHQPPGSP